MSSLWTSDTKIRKWILSRPCEIFREKYDTVAEQVMKIGCMDDLLSGTIHCEHCSMKLGITLYFRDALEI